MYVLVVTHDADYSPPDVYGPFTDVPTAQQFAELYRSRVNLADGRTVTADDLHSRMLAQPLSPAFGAAVRQQVDHAVAF